MNAPRITIDRAIVTRVLALVAALFVVINLGMQWYRIHAGKEYVSGLAMMSLDGEHNLPELFSTLLLLGAAALLTLITLLERARRGRDTGKWALLAAGFVCMAVDESLSLHEALIEPVRHLLGGGELGLFYFAWVVPALVLVAALGIYFLPFMLRLPRRTMLAFAASAAIYLGGAVGVELFEGMYREHHAYRTLGFHLLVTLEEGMEMTGVIAFIHALLGHIAGRFGEVRLGITGVAVASQEAAHTIGRPSPTSP